MTQNVPILVYHHVYPDGEPGLASPSGKKATGMIGVSEFRRHLSYVAENGWEVVSTTRIVDWLEGSASLPRRAVALHFDNGWLDAFTVALPVLQEFGMTATSFVITDGTTAASEGRTARVRTSTEGEIQKPFVTWEHAARLLEAGWEIAAHTATHPRLGELHSTSGADAVLEEIEDSNEVFAQRLGFVPEHFAYPSGSRSEQTDALLARHYRSLRLWSFSHPPVWRFTGRETSPLAMECQNIDNTVSFEDFTRIFSEAQER